MSFNVKHINPDALNDIVHNTLESEGFRTVNTMKSGAARDSGELRNGISSSVENNTLTIKADAKHSGWVEHGTGIHNELGNGRQTPWVYFYAKINRFVTTRGMRSQPFFFHNMEKLEKTIPITIASKLDSWGRK